MKSIKTPNRKINVVPLLAGLLCLPFLLFTAGQLAAQNPEQKKEQAGPNKNERLISLVLLLREPRQLDDHKLANSVSEAVGIAHSHDTKAEDFVVAKPPYYQVKLQSNRFIVNNIDKPYFEESAKLAAEVKDPALRDAVQKHRAWLSIDWAEKQEPSDVKMVYQQIGKMAAALAGPDTLAIYCPDTDQLSVYKETVAGQLKSDDPLQAFGGTGGVSDVVSVKSDDPRLKQAEAEAKQHWPEFVQAFKQKSGEKFAVKGRIAEGEKAEYMWLSVTDVDGEEVHGTLDNEPAALTGFKMGQDLHVKLSDVDDWVYIGPDKKPHGAFTMKALDEASQANPKS